MAFVPPIGDNRSLGKLPLTSMCHAHHATCYDTHLRSSRHSMDMLPLPRTSFYLRTRISKWTKARQNRALFSGSASSLYRSTDVYCGECAPVGRWWVCMGTVRTLADDSWLVFCRFDQSTSFTCDSALRQENPGGRRSSEEGIQKRMGAMVAKNTLPIGTIHILARRVHRHMAIGVQHGIQSYQIHQGPTIELGTMSYVDPS